jgi:4'-phosphopantetheinyl transferase
MLWNNPSAERDTPDIGWAVQRRGDVPPGVDWLTAAEKEKLEQLRFTKRRADWRLGRWTAKRAVCAFLGGSGETGYREVEVISNPDGVPEVCVDGTPDTVGISISHAGGVGFCAVAAPGLAVGCDVETVEARRDSFISDYFTEDEKGFVYGLDPAKRPLFVTLIWSAKESTLKAIRKGLSRDTRTVNVRVDRVVGAGGWSGLQVKSADPERSFRGWWRTDGTSVYTVVADESPAAESPRKLI